MNYNPSSSSSLLREYKGNVGRSRYYDILNIPTNADMSEIKKAYRKKALICHPDKGGKKDQWLELQKAYETLIDPLKRELYDHYGENSFKMTIINNACYNREEHELKTQKRLKMKSLYFTIQITLEDSYFGRKKAFEIKRNRICITCNGKGGLMENIYNCPKCKGNGYCYFNHAFIIGSLENYCKCTECNGEGKLFKVKCLSCFGRKITMAKKQIEIIITKGIKDGAQYTLVNEGEDYPGFDPGDIIVTYKIKEHSLFKRNGNDLLMTTTINLLQSLTGLDMTITLIDNKKIIIKNKQGDVITPGMIKTIKNKGMPIENKPEEYGNLNIQFNVLFPTKIDLNQLKQFRLLLTQEKSLLNNNNRSSIFSRKPIEKGRTVIKQSLPVIFLTDYNPSN